MSPITTSLASLSSTSSSATGPPAPILPVLSPYGTFEGSLFQFHRNLVAFESSPKTLSPPFPPPPHKCILLGGLSDGLLPTPYTSLLERTCHTLGWSLVQPILSSSYLGFGNGDLDRDTEELSHLLHYLSVHRAGHTFSFVGHSTGCQNSVHFLKHGSKDMVKKIKFVALQAPVSDREDAATASPKEYEENIEVAEELVARGDGEEMMPRKSFWAPITASRFLDLQGLGGADDFFSSDLTDRQLIKSLKHVGKLESSGLRLLAAYSGQDQYVPKHVDKKLLVGRICNAMNEKCVDREVATPLFLATGNHNLSEGEGDAEKFVGKVGEFLEVVMALEDEKGE